MFLIKFSQRMNNLTLTMGPCLPTSLKLRRTGRRDDLEKPVTTRLLKNFTLKMFLILSALLVACQAMYAQAPAAVGKDVPELMQLIEKRKTAPTTPINMQGKQLQGAQLPNKVNLSNANFTGSDFSNATLSGALLTDAVLHNVNFTHAKLQDVTFIDSYAKRVNMSGADLSRANFSGSGLENVNFKNANLSNAKFTDTFLESIQTTGNIKLYLTNANLTNANFTNAKLKYVDLVGAICINTNFTDADLISCDLKKANLTGATLTNAIFNNVDARAANFTKSKGFTSITFTDTYLNKATGITFEQQVYARSKGAKGVPGEDIPRLMALLEQRKKDRNTPIIMPKADLNGVPLLNANLMNAQLNGADLSGADLRGALLHKSQLNDANLQGAELENAHFINAKLKGANLSNTKGIYAVFIAADLTGADFTETTGLSHVNFARVNAAGVKGLTAAQKASMRASGAQNVPL